jgi:hypothetical protein
LRVSISPPRVCDTKSIELNYKLSRFVEDQSLVLDMVAPLKRFCITRFQTGPVIFLIEQEYKPTKSPLTNYTIPLPIAVSWNHVQKSNILVPFYSVS